jgi:hypothetical protein
VLVCLVKDALVFIFYCWQSLIFLSTTLGQIFLEEPFKVDLRTSSLAAATMLTQSKIVKLFLTIVNVSAGVIIQFI